MEQQELDEGAVEAQQVETPQTKKPIMTAEAWKPFLAFAFILIILFDFVVAPAYVGAHRMPMDELVVAMQGLPEEMQAKLLEENFRTWKPITLGDGVGMFYIAVGAILTGVAVTRNGVGNVLGRR